MRSFPFKSGVYLLEIFLFKPVRIEVGARGKEVFPPGYYYYTGTAQNNLQDRLKRHQQDEKNMHWHIDYFLDEGSIQQVYAIEEPQEIECELAGALLEKEKSEVVAPGFGSSDCQCETHLIYFPEPLGDKTVEELLEDVKKA